MERYALAPLLQNRDTAAAEKNKIYLHRGYCPAGLLPSLCEDLRHSREARASARRAHPIPTDASFETRARALERLLQAVDENHRRHDLLRFPWEQNLTVAPGTMNPHHALRVLRTLARERPVSHLLVRDTDGRLTLGSTLPCEIVWFLPLIPFFALCFRSPRAFPFVPEEGFIIGDTMDWLSLVSLPLRALSRLQARLKVSLRHATSPFKGVHTHVQFRDDHLLPQPFADAQAEFERKLQAWADEFPSKLELPARIHVKTEATMLGELEIGLRGLSKLDEMLFFYDVAHEKAGAGGSNP